MGDRGVSERGRRWTRWLGALLLAGWLAASPSRAVDEEVYVSAIIEPLEAELGQTVLYRAFATVRNNVTHSLSPQEPSFDGFERVDGDVDGQPRLNRSENSDQTIFEWSYELRPVRTGTLLIPPFRVRYVDRETGRRHTVAGERVSLRVVAAGASGATPSPATPAAGDEDSDIRPAKPPVPLPMIDPLWIVGGLAALLVLLAVAAVVVLNRREVKPVPVAPLPEPPKPAAHTLALSQLAALEAERLPERGEIDPYHIRLAQIVRDYLSERFNIEATRSTTTEIALSLYDRHVPSETIALCRRVLSGCDLEKFAAYRPGVPEMQALLAEARRLIHRTTMLDEAASPAATASPNGRAAAPEPTATSDAPER